MKEKRTRISAYGLITDDEDRILLCRLSSIVEQHAGKWILPGGGLEFGETPAQAVIREVKEETGLTASVGDLLNVDTSVFEFEDRIVHAIRIIYRATVESGNLVVEQGGSTDACEWFGKDQIKDLNLPMVSLVAISQQDLKHYDLSTQGLIDFYTSKDDPRSKMTVDYLNEYRTIQEIQLDNARKRLREMGRYPRK